MLIVIALALLNLDLFLMILLLRGDVRRLEAQVRREHNLAKIFQQVARDERERGDAWRDRAQHPQWAAWEVIENAVPGEPEVPDAIRRAWEQEP